MCLIRSSAMSLALAATQAQLPPIDSDGRRKTLENFGYADTNMNASQRAFIRGAIKETKSGLADDGRIPIAVDVGAGYGDLAMRVLKRGGNILYIDVSRGQADYVEQTYNYLKNEFPGILEILVGSMPYNLNRYDDHQFMALYQFQKKYKIVRIGSHSMVLYLSGPKRLDFLKWAFMTLPSGGHLNLSGVSRYSRVFPGYLEAIHEQKVQNFLADPSKEPYPGFVDTRDPALADFVPEGYSNSYPPEFHFLDPEDTAYYARQVGFLVKKAGFSRRLYPERLRYTGEDPKAGEITILDLVKP